MPFAALLAEVREPRRGQGQRCSRRHLLLSSVPAVLTGAASCQGIITFIALQRARRNTVFGAGFRRAPAVNTLRHLFLALGRDDPEAAFRRHARGLSGRTPEAMRTIALEGKPLHSPAAHLLSAFAGDAALILAHPELAAAPGEIPAPPRVVAGPGPTGVLFTADARHCPTEGSARAAETGNALLVRGKDNPPTLPAALAGPCAEQPPFRHDATADRRHGRQEHRRVELFDPAGHLDAPWQPRTACVARVSRLTHTKDTRSGPWPTREEIGYDACQVRRDAKSLAQAIRAHWGIENRDHCVRDVTLGEDGSRIRKRPGVMARIRLAALNILRANGMQNVSQALYTHALSFDRLPALGSP